MSEINQSKELRQALSQCEQEPIHIPGGIQPHGLLFVLSEPDFRIMQASRNVASALGVEFEQVLQSSLGDLLGDRYVKSLARALTQEEIEKHPLYVGTWTLATAERPSFNAVVHRRQDVLLLELELTSTEDDLSFANLYPLVRESLGTLESVNHTEELCQLAAKQIRLLTGFDKVMIYQFDADWNGSVLAEEMSEGMESYLGQRFPAGDIPRQARELYLLNRLRLIATVDYQPVPVMPVLNPETGRPLDMSLSLLRSVSPVHLEYLRNMGIAASMSISIIQEGRLWGLVACHHREAKYLPFEVRTACEFLGQVLAHQLQTSEERELTERRLNLRPSQSRLLSSMALHRNVAQGLKNCEADLLGLVGASGAVIGGKDGFTFVGVTPTAAQVSLLIGWMRQHEKELSGHLGVITHHALPSAVEGAEDFQGVAAGLMAIGISEVEDHYVMWFRPEVVQTIRWAGDPTKSMTSGPGGDKIHPRRSFQVWKETVAGQAIPWSVHEIEAAAELRRDIISIVLRQAEERARLSGELERSNKELEAFSYSVSHDLRAPFRHITGLAKLLQKRAADQLDETSLRYIENMSEAAYNAGTLVDGLLQFSQMGRSELHRTRIDMNALVREVRRELEGECEDREVAWEVEDLPEASGDLVMLRLVWQNLLSNAIKYTRQREKAIIQVQGFAYRNELVYTVRDNGAGFDMRHAGKLFGVFERLHRAEEFEGTGIGLANVRRIVSRHGGRTWAEGDVNKGAAFSFSLPLSSTAGMVPDPVERNNG